MVGPRTRIVAALALVWAGLGTVPVGPAPPAAEAAGAAVRDNAFVPAALTVRPGEDVVWQVTGLGSHTVTADGLFDSSPRCPSGLLSCLNFGDSFRHTFATSGTFEYYCRVHRDAGMVGTVVVQAAVPPPATRPPPTTTTAPPSTPPASATTSTLAAATTTTSPGTDPDEGLGDELDLGAAPGTTAPVGLVLGGGSGDDAGAGAALLFLAVVAVAVGGGAALWRLRPGPRRPRGPGPPGPPSP